MLMYFIKIDLKYRTININYFFLDLTQYLYFNSRLIINIYILRYIWFVINISFTTNPIIMHSII